MQRPISPRTWSRSSRSSPATAALALGLALGGSGCGKSSAPAPRATPVGPTERAYVRLESLRESVALPALSTLTVPALTTASRPPALSPLNLPQTTGWEQAQARRTEGRVALQSADQKGLQAFGERLRARQDRLLTISQSQFEAQERLQMAGKAAEDRSEAQRTVADQVLALKDDLALAQTQYQISRALASPANDTLLFPDEPEKVAAEVERLKAAQLRAAIQVDPVTGVRRARVLWANGVPPRNPRVHYAASRDVLEVLCRELEARITTAETTAEQKRQQSADERESEIKQRVGQRLEGLKSRDETFLLRLDQEESLGRVLLAEELPTRRAAGRAPGSPLPAVKSLRAPKGSSPTATTTLERGWQVAQEADLRARVQDVAQRRGILVSFSPQPGVPDRTAEFARWIKVSLR